MPTGDGVHFRTPSLKFSPELPKRWQEHRNCFCPVRAKGYFMINISTSHVVSWPTPAGPAVAPVSPITAVQPVRESGRDPQTGFGAGRDGQGAASRAPANRGAPAEADATPEPAPLLPRSYGPAGADGRTGPQADLAAAQLKNQQQAEQAAAQQAEEQAEAANRKQQLQAVLTTVWQASAAVVERALDQLAGSPSELPGTQSDTSPDLSAVAAAQMNRRPLLPPAVTQTPLEPLPWPVMPPSDETTAAVEAPADILAVEDVVAYDENGNGSRAPVEAGSIISERV